MIIPRVEREALTGQHPVDLVAPEEARHPAAESIPLTEAPEARLLAAPRPAEQWMGEAPRVDKRLVRAAPQAAEEAFPVAAPMLAADRPPRAEPVVRR